ncbi:MAG: hypothetical protein M1813_006269 [Trichoglossum hirsutum]|nr:MAG: hypothetical protein M1813_006269 [Trichoglossum hirsutum]
MNARKNSSAVSPNEATKTASAQRLRTSDYHSDPPSAESSSVNSPGHVPSPPDEINSSESNPQGIIIRKPPISDAATVQVSNHTSAHIVLPSLASRTASSGSLTSLRRCVVDISASTASGMSFAGLALKDIRDSLIVCGNVNGPAHITEVKNSVIVVACRQFRMHDCKEVDVYLLCSSRPIIEDCHGIRFAPLPESYMPEPEQQIENQWDRVDDFKWLKVEHSPNWSVLPPEKRITPQFWGDVVRGGPDIALSNILKETILARQ